jgi:exopolysaccharide production protein ExoZ
LPDSVSRKGAATIRLVQALRAAACVMVVIYHATRAVSPDRGWANGAAGVDLFFVISGYVMLRSSRGLMGAQGGWARFLARRIRRLVPLYWTLTAAKLLFTMARPSLAPLTHPTARSVLADLLFIPARDGAGIVRPLLAVGWTLNFEFFFSALFAACLAARMHPLWMSPLLFGLTAAGFWHEDAWPAPFYFANGVVLEFAAGMALAAMPARLGTRTALCLAITGCALLLAVPSLGPWRCIMWGVPASCIIAAALALEPTWGCHVPAPLVAAGDASYAIYLIHPFVVAALARYGTAPTLAASLAAGLLLHRVVDARLQRFVGTRTRAIEAKEGQGSALDPLGPEAPDPHFV